MISTLVFFEFFFVGLEGFESCSSLWKMPPVPWDDTITFEKLVSFCEKNDIPTTGALALTLSRNRTGEYASLIVDMEERKFYDLYPKPLNQVYREGPVSEDQEFLYCYQAVEHTSFFCAC